MVDETRLLTNARLAELCRLETDRYRREQASDDRFCFELIRRAVHNIGDAAQRVYTLYWPWLEAKVMQRCRGEDPDTIKDLTQESITRFFQYVTPESWSRFERLAPLLSYMGKCCESVVIAFRRRRERQARIETALQADLRQRLGARVEAALTFEQLRQQLWECVRRNCNDEHDFWLAEQLWVYEAKPRHIADKHPQRFETTVEIYKRKRNLIDRIKRDEECQALRAYL